MTPMPPPPPSPSDDPGFDLTGSTTARPSLLRRAWSALGTVTKLALICAALVLVVAVVYLAYDKLSSLRDERALHRLSEEKRALEAQNAKLLAEAALVAEKLKAKEAEAEIANQRALAAEANLAEAIRATSRAATNYHRARDQPQSSQIPAPSISELCEQLKALGKSCAP